MLSNEEMMRRLRELKPHEAVAKEYYEKYGTFLSFSQFLVLFQNPNKVYRVDEIASPAFAHLSTKAANQFRDIYGASLNEASFFQESSSIELQQLLRYIETPAHSHDFVECIFVLYGYCEHTVGTHTYRHGQGACAIIVAGVRHCLRPSPDCLCITIKIRKDVFSGFDIPNFPYFVYPIGFQLDEDPFVFNILLTIYAQQEGRYPYAEQKIHLLMKALLLHICQHYWDTLQHLAPHSAHSKQILDITNFIYENYQTVTLGTLAEQFHFNPSYLSNLIHRQTGVSFSAIVRDIRLRQAARMLCQTNLSLNQICADIGYHDVSQFISSFRKKYGMTPVQYRKSNKETSPTI